MKSMNYCFVCDVQGPSVIQAHYSIVDRQHVENRLAAHFEPPNPMGLSKNVSNTTIGENEKLM